jgi:hypothetical protein
MSQHLIADYRDDRCEEQDAETFNDIRSGRLVPLLMQHVSKCGAIYIYYGHRAEQSLRVRTFIDFMIEKLADNRAFFLDRSELAASIP